MHSLTDNYYRFQPSLFHHYFSGRRGERFTVPKTGRYCISLFLETAYMSCLAPRTCTSTNVVAHTFAHSRVESSTCTPLSTILFYSTYQRSCQCNRKKKKSAVTYLTLMSDMMDGRIFRGSTRAVVHLSYPFVCLIHDWVPINCACKELEP